MNRKHLKSDSQWPKLGVHWTAEIKNRLETCLELG